MPTINVGPGGFATIQAGINAAAAGDTIVVAAGTYNENLLIDKQITMLSLDGAGTTNIVGSPGSSLGTVVVAPGVNGVVIGDTGQGFTIIGFDDTPAIETAAVYLDGAHDGFTLRGNNVVANGDSGLFTEFGSAAIGFVIDGNEFAGQTFTGGGPGSGDQFVNANVARQLIVIGNTTLADGVQFTNNQITGTSGGIATSGPSTGQRVGNIMVTIDGTNAVVADNTWTGFSTGSNAFGLRIRADGAIVSDNTFDNAGGSNSRGFTNSGNPGTFTGNTFTGGSPDADTIFGTPGADAMAGNDGNDFLLGRAGADDITGGDGRDDILGAAGDDVLQGDAGADGLRGGDGADVLRGGAGADVLRGGAGFDVASYADGGSVTVSLASGTASDGDTLSEIEDLVGSGGDDTLTGDGGSNLLEGGAGGDTLNGGGQLDALIGGEGDDTLIGGAFIDSMDGGAGFDFISYQGSTAGVTASLATQSASGGDAVGGETFASIEGLIGGAHGDTLTGNGSANTLKGLDGDDTLTGRGGMDTLMVGKGSDIIVLTALGDSPVGSGRDRVNGFVSGIDDINLTAIDADTSLDGNQAFVFINTAEFSGTAGELRYNGSVLQGDVDGDALADFQIQLYNVPTLAVGDLVL